MPVTAGSIKLDGKDLLQIPGHKRAHLGIGYMPEERRLIPALSVQDNIMMPAWARNLEAEKGDERLNYIYRLMPDLGAWADRKATQLSGGQQKMVALGRALMSGTKVLLLDEPFEGLAPLLGQLLGEIIQNIQGEGLAILIAESDDKRLSFVQDMFTIERGEIVQNGDQKAKGH
jgi:branched-chain amino acid transport system ATP-binding protein